MHMDLFVNKLRHQNEAEQRDFCLPSAFSMSQIRSSLNSILSSAPDLQLFE